MPFESVVVPYYFFLIMGRLTSYVRRAIDMKTKKRPAVMNAIF